MKNITKKKNKRKKKRKKEEEKHVTIPEINNMQRG
jgi:hypothetical protein